MLVLHISKYLFQCHSLSKGVLRKTFSENIHQIYRRTSMPKCDFNKVAEQLYWNYTSVRVFSCKFLHIFRTSFSGNTSGGLLRWKYFMAKSYKLFLQKRVIIIIWHYSKYASEIPKKTGFYLFHIFLSWWNLGFCISGLEILF